MALHRGNLESNRDKRIKNKKLKAIKNTDFRVTLKLIKDENYDNLAGLRLKFYMDDLLQPAPRPRQNHKSGITYNPSSSYRNHIKKIIKELIEEEVNNGNISDFFDLDEFPLNDVYVKCDLKITAVPPKSYSKKKILYALLGLFKLVKKPDVDNILKEFMDICNKVIFNDDGCVNEAHLLKEYGYKNQTMITLDIFRNVLPEGKLNKQEASKVNKMIEKIVYQDKTISDDEGEE